MDYIDFFKGKRVLVTGHTGFKGGWLSAWLLDLGANVAGYALEPNTTPSLYDVLDLKNKMVDTFGDIRNRDHLRSFLEEFQPEIVIHMAAQAIVRESYEDPITTYETNVMGTVNILEICRDLPSVRSIIIITSDKCYENSGKNKPFKEADPMGGHDPYSSSKGCTELVVAAYLRSFFNPEKYGEEHRIGLASARAGNVIGGGDWSRDRLIPDCIQAISKNENVVIRYPESVRPWQHVLEPLYGYLLLVQKLYEEGSKFSGPWNFGPDKKNEKPVRVVVDEIHKLWGDNQEWDLNSDKQPHESVYLRLDSKKSRSNLKWGPRLALSPAISATVDWYKAWQNKADMYEFSLNQIRNYMKGEKA